MGRVPSAKTAMTIVAPGPQLARVRDRSGVGSSSSHGHDLLPINCYLHKDMLLHSAAGAQLAVEIITCCPDLARVGDHHRVEAPCRQGHQVSPGSVYQGLQVLALADVPRRTGQRLGAAFRAVVARWAQHRLTLRSREEGRGFDTESPKSRSYHDGSRLWSLLV